MQIAQLMTRNVKTCRLDERLDRVAKLMWDHDIGVVPVVDDDGQLVGIVTDRDACMAAMIQREPLHALPVSIAMTRHVVTCRGEDSDEHVATLMIKHKIRRVPVVDDDQRPVGMVSINDLALASAHGEPIPEGEITGTLAAVSEHRVA
jgi:CBS domain-containing protein